MRFCILRQALSNTLTVRRRVACGLALVVFGTEAVAVDCGWIGNAFNICEAAKLAGKEGAEEVTRGLDKATLNMRDMTNQFGGLIADLHGTDEARKARARGILEGVLGINGEISKTFSLQYSVRLVAPKDVAVEVDSYLFSKDDNGLLVSLFSNDKSAFQGHLLNAIPVTPISETDLVKSVVEAAGGFRNWGQTAQLECAKLKSVEGDSYSICVQNTYDRLLAAVALAARGARNAAQNIPAGNRYTAAAPGGIAAILIKRADIAVMRAKDAYFEVWVHETDKPEAPILQFSDPSRRMVFPLKIFPGEFESSVRCITSSKPHGDICFLWVPLRLERIVGEAKELERGFSRPN